MTKNEKQLLGARALELCYENVTYESLNKITDLSEEEILKVINDRLCIRLNKLRHHETCKTDFGVCIMRVPSGYLYDCWDYEIDKFKQGIFVPFEKG